MLSTEVATPTVAVAITSASLSVNGPVNAATIRSANTSTASASGASSMSSANSSPPSRAAVSDGRTDAASRPATAASSSSPLPWPIVSFTTLKSSRSTKSTPTVRSVRRAWSMRVRHPLGEQHPVRQAGQRVVVGLVLQLLLKLVLLGDIAQGEHHAADGPVAAQVA